MNQEQPMRPEAERALEQPITYGDLFPVAGALAQQPISSQDAAMMQSAENRILGQTQKGGAAAKMQAAATHNEQAGFVPHASAATIPSALGVTVSKTDVLGAHVVTEFVAGQEVGQHKTLTPAPAEAAAAVAGGAITIGEALEASALAAGDKPIERSDAAAIQAAEARATGFNVTVTRGIAAEGQSAAEANARAGSGKEKTLLADVLMDATARLPADKPATREDAEKVVAAELRNSPGMTTQPGGVAASIVAAARINEEKGI